MEEEGRVLRVFLGSRSFIERAEDKSHPSLVRRGSTSEFL